MTEKITYYQWKIDNGEPEDSDNFYESTHVIAIPIDPSLYLTYEWWDYPYGRSASFGAQPITPRQAISLVDNPLLFLDWVFEQAIAWYPVLLKEYDRKLFLEQKAKEAILEWEKLDGI